MTVALPPVRLPFTGADWPNWRIFGDVMIKSSFDLGVDIMIWTTGYRDSKGGKAAGIGDMSRVEGRIEKGVSLEDPTKPDWRLTYWQAGYDRVQSVDERVAKRTVAILRRILAAPMEEKPKVPEEKPKIAESPKTPKSQDEWDEWVESDGVEKQGYDGLRELIYSFSIAGLIGFALKQGWRVLMGRHVYWVKSLIKVIIINFFTLAFVLFCFWVYFWFFNK